MDSTQNVRNNCMMATITISYYFFALFCSYCNGILNLFNIVTQTHVVPIHKKSIFLFANIFHSFCLRLYFSVRVCSILLCFKVFILFLSSSLLHNFLQTIFFCFLFVAECLNCINIFFLLLLLLFFSVHYFGSSDAAIFI